MTSHVRRHERAQRDERPALCPHILEGGADQPATYSQTRVLLVDLGVDEDMAATADVIDGHARLDPVDSDDVGVPLGHVTHFYRVLLRQIGPPGDKI
jgi:hypothetical protein